MFVFYFIFVTVLTESQSYFQGIELLSDVNYFQGFDVIPACNSDPTECAKAPRYRLYNPFSILPNRSAPWQMAQWASHSNLSSNGIIIDDGKSKGMQWATADKRFILFQDGRLQFAVNGFHEYEGKYKPLDAPWVHLLIEQDIGKTGGSVPLSQVNELRWNLNIQLLYMNKNIQPGYNPNLHAAIFPLYMTIQNLVEGDPEYGKYFWLGICLYDDRVAMSPLYVNGDKGTGSLIYSPAFSNFANVSVQSQTVVHVTGDVMPFVRLGLQAAVQRGFLSSTDLNKYYVGGMNIGWEITGLNIGTIEISNLSLKQYTAQNPRSYEFNNDVDTDGWSEISSTSRFVSYAMNGKWHLSPLDNNHQLLSPTFMIDTSVIKKIIIGMTNYNLFHGHLRIFWNRDGNELFNHDDKILMTYIDTQKSKECVLDLSQSSNWNGLVRRIRIDFQESRNSSRLSIDYIRFSSL